MIESRQNTTLCYRTIVLSDVHLGAPGCQIDKVNHFLRHTRCDKLILNGDIIDGWSLGRRGGWTKEHTRFIHIVLQKIKMEQIEVIYLRGNHDDFLAAFPPLVFGLLTVTERYIHEGVRGRYLVMHGDAFDSVTKHSRFLAILGDIGYQLLLRLNQTYNRYRSWRGKEYFSLSRAIKERTKTLVSFVSRFESNIEDVTRREGCDGFICGHIHTPEDKHIGKIHYLNSGDWIESNTALIEHTDGRWEILNYRAFRERLSARDRTEVRPVAIDGPSARADGNDGDERPAIFIPA